jgi:endoglycosylceramidase
MRSGFAVRRIACAAPLLVALLGACAGSRAAAAAGGADPGAMRDAADAAREVPADPAGEPDAVAGEAPVEAPEPAGVGDVAGMPPDASDAAPEAPDAPDAVAPWPGPGEGFRVRGSAILDPDGRVVLLHGANASNDAKYVSDHLTWETGEDFAALAATGLDAVRLLTFWGAIEPADGAYDAAYLDGYVAKVDAAAAAGLLVIVDMHQDVFGFGFDDNGAPPWACDASEYASYVPQEPWFLDYATPQVKACFDRFYSDDVLFGKFQAAWVTLATRLADHPAVVGFDLLNEPSAGSMASDAWLTGVWQPREAQLTAALVAAAPHKVVFWQGETLSNVAIVDPFTPGPAGVAYTPHYYHPLVHAGGAYEPDTMRGQLDDAVAAMAASAVNLGGVPVWVGEFGGDPTVTNFLIYLEDLLSRFAAHAWSWTVYSDDRAPDDAFGIRDATGAFLPDVVRRLGHPAPHRVPGPIRSQAVDAGAGTLDATFDWVVDAPLVLWAGTGGTTVDVSPVAGGTPAGCVAAAAGPAGLLECARPAGSPAGATWRVTVAPAGSPPATLPPAP